MVMRSSILASVHAVETPSPQVCENPLCTVEFPESGLKIEPKRYCSPTCRQQASLIHRVAKLLTMLSDEEVITVLRGPRVVFADFARPNRPTGVT